MRTLRVGLGQINTTVGDLEGNSEKILRVIAQAKNLGVDLVAFPELSITGYPPEDLLLKPQFVQDNLKCLQKVIENTKDISAIVGFVDRRDDIYNAAAIINNGRLAGVYHKMYLPNYGVFDELRYFQMGTEYPFFVLKGVNIGVNICEDIWYPGGPTEVQCLAGNAEVIINISASPYHRGKGEFRQKMLSTRAADNVAIVCFVNLVGGQDELVFDGNSMIFDQRGNLIARGKQFEEDLIIADLSVEAVFGGRLHDPRRRKEKLGLQIDENKLKRIELAAAAVHHKKPPLPEREIRALGKAEEIYRALILGTRDYVKKNGFDKVVIGLSGGIDSSLTAVIAVDALGKDNVIGVSMPSQYSAEESQSDADLLARNLGVEFLTIPIECIFQSYLKALKGQFSGLGSDVTEENIQARIRGTLLMALSNKFGWLVLTTGNKSELSTGYCTLYGDMAGGFAVLKDVPKILVYELAKYRNSLESKPLIPPRVLEKEPSAELRANQKDTDTLPPYPILDPILEAYVEKDESFEGIVSLGFEEKTVKRVLQMVDRSEYKRRQSPPGIKITPRALGKDRRLPISNRYHSF